MNILADNFFKFTPNAAFSGNYFNVGFEGLNAAAAASSQSQYPDLVNKLNFSSGRSPPPAHENVGARQAFPSKLVYPPNQTSPGPSSSRSPSPPSTADTLSNIMSLARENNSSYR